MRFVWLIFIFLTALTAPARADVPTFFIQDGVLDLRGWDPIRTPTFQVQGPAEFYWEKFIQTDGAPLESRTLIEFPGAWNLKGKFPYHGYGSVRLRILLPKIEVFSIQWTWVWTTVEAYANGKLIHKSGQIGRDADSAKPGNVVPWITHLTPHNGEIELVLQMSNFDLFLGGHVDVVTMGTQEGILKARDRKVIVDSFILGSIFIMAFYHMTLFMLRRQDPSTLYFGLFCLMIGAHMTTGTRTALLTSFGDIGFRDLILLYNYSWMISIPCFGFFTEALFPDEFTPLINRIVITTCACFLIFIGSTEVRTFIWSTQIYQILALCGNIYLIYVVIRATRNKRPGAWTFLGACIMLVIGSINDMLMIRGVLNTIPLAAVGLFLFIFGQSYLLSVRFSRAFTRAESSEARVRKLADDLQVQNSQILELNETLESRVEDQTREIRSIMEHTPIAIFAIEGVDAVIHRDYSLRLEDILEEKQLAGRPALPMLFAASSLSLDEQDQLLQAMSAMVGEPSVAFDLNEQKLPRAFTRIAKNSDVKQFEAVWNPILDESGTISKILVALTDVTEVRHLASAARERAEELQTIGEIISVKDEVFQRFLRSCKTFNLQNRQLLEGADPKVCEPEVVKVIFMNMHTMKGSARTLRFKKLASIFHDLETSYTQLARQGQATWNVPRMLDDMNAIDSALLEYEKIAVEKLGRKLGEGTMATLPIPAVNEGFQELHTAAVRHDLTPGLRNLYTALQDALFMPLPVLMEEIFVDVRSLAKDLDKPIPQVVFQIPHVLVRLQAEEVLRNTFVHLLRNALDHGIEAPEERTRRGKDTTGHLTLTGEVLANKVCLWLEDDGRGLNLKHLLALGRERGRLPLDAEPDAASCAHLIFSDGISTAKAVTAISGRGMGMAAVQSYIHEAGGTIHVELKPHITIRDEAAPFRLRLELPLSLFSQKMEWDEAVSRSA
jgi:HPt (histidine-containing phosphotransfer) domain-containing protein